jgi:hypothetical protein
MGSLRGGLVALLVTFVGCGLAACGGSAEPAPKVPPPPPPAPEEAADPTWHAAQSRPAAPVEEEPPPPPVEKACAEPEFKEGATVSEAISAVDSCWKFQGIEPDVLAAPLKDPELFKPCKLQSAHKFQLRLAIWDGRVVGADVQSVNLPLKKCIETQVRGLKYAEQLKALNTVEYSF